MVLGIVIYGIYSIDLSLPSLLIMAGFGLLGYVMAKLDYPSVPLIMGVVLGPLMELGVRRTLIASRGDLSVLYTHPISLTIFIATAVVLLWPLIGRLFSRALKTSQA